jgi:Spy/CpxP family protein refolding chaperone
MQTPQNKSLVSIIIFLLLTNIAMLIFFLFLGNTSRRGHGNRDENFFSNILQKEVGFNDNQITAFKKLKEDQMHKLHPLFEDVRTSKDSFYRLLYVNPLPDSLFESKAESIGQKQAALDMQMFRNLKSIRNLCTPEQLPRFDSSIKTIVERMTGRSRKPGNAKDHK